MIPSVSQVISQRWLTNYELIMMVKETEELRAYLRRAVAKDFHRVGFNCDEAVINKFVEHHILDQERKRMEGEENPKIKENYVMPKGNFMSYNKLTGGHDPPTLPSNIKDSAANQKVLAEEAMSHQQVPRKRELMYGSVFWKCTKKCPTAKEMILLQNSRWAIQ
jgi:hypothetical protein